MQIAALSAGPIGKDENLHAVQHQERLSLFSKSIIAVGAWWIQDHQRKHWLSYRLRCPVGTIIPARPAGASRTPPVSAIACRGMSVQVCRSVGVAVQGEKNVRQRGRRYSHPQRQTAGSGLFCEQRSLRLSQPVWPLRTQRTGCVPACLLLRG